MLLKNNFSQQEQSFTALVSGPWYYACLPTDSGIHLCFHVRLFFLWDICFLCACVCQCVIEVYWQIKKLWNITSTQHTDLLFLLFFFKRIFNTENKKLQVLYLRFFTLIYHSVKHVICTWKCFILIEGLIVI